MSKSVLFATNATKCHLRALSYEKPFLFVGMGSTLQVFKTDSNGLNELVLNKIIFKNFIINGIKTFVNFESDSDIEINVVINGNRFLSIYRFLYNNTNEKTSLNQLVDCHNFYHLILTLKMIGSLVFVVQAHNEVVVFDWKTNRVIETISGTDKCILYSAELLSVSDSPKGFVVSSGTVFKEIVIWSSFETNCGFVSNCLQRLRGHDGVIFALNYSKSLNLLVSASDDRSVRIWTSDSQQSEDSVKFWSQNKLSLSHIFYGHLSRIWSVCTISNPYPIVISVGEDSSVYFWNINDKKLIQRVDGHKNSSIWSLTLDTQSMITFSGGSDSCITCLDILNTITPFESLVRHDLEPKQLVFIRLENLNIFCATINGDLNIMSTNSRETNSIRNSDYNHIFESYSAIDVNPKRNQILLASKYGDIAIIEINPKLQNPFEIRIKRVHNSKIFSICFVDSFSFMSCGIGGEVKVWSFSDFSLIGEYILPNSRHRWPVAGLLHKQVLVLGDRCGSVFVYKNETPNPIKTYRHLHGSNGVTAIKLKPKTDLMYSCGRNGKIFEFLLEDLNCSLLRVYRIFSDMEWIGKFEFDEITNEMSYICGFESRNFMVWDDREQRYVDSIDCGGGHRSWDFTLFSNRFYFCYSKQKSIICLDKALPKMKANSKLMIGRTSHSKKINSSSLLFVNNSSIYFSTAGEDNVIHINSLDLVTNQWKVESYLFGHISNVSALTSSCCENSSDSCFLVSVGGRSQLMVWKIELKDKNIICKQLVNKFLWSSDNIQNITKRTNLNSSSLDSQIRYLDAFMTKVSEDKYLISTACSDSAFRLFAFDSNSLSFELLNISTFTTSCVLKVFNVLDSYVITASNDGTLKIWTLIDRIDQKLSSDEFESKQMNLDSMFEMRLHESGINALDVFQFNDNLWLIGSGGDDNTLVLSLFKSSANGLTRISSVDEKYIHSAQISGIQIISDSTILSASIDQRIIVWKYILDFEKLSLKLEPIATHISSIADISSFCSTFLTAEKKWQLIVCGEGFEAIKYSIN